MPIIPRRTCLVIAALTLLFAGGCGRTHSNAQGGANSVTVETPPSLLGQTGQTAELNGDQAIKLVKQMIDQSGLTARLQRPYSDTQMQSVPCSPQEVDMDQSAYPNNPELRHCQSFGAGPPMKRVPVTTTHCCQTTALPIKSSDISNWRAEPASDDKWRVFADYAVAGESHHSSWLVDRKDQEISAQMDE
jgi:hypothetical protein